MATKTVKKRDVSTVEEARLQVVAQGNDLIRHARSQFTEQEQNLLYFMISRVKPNDKNLMEQTFTIKEVCEVCGIKTEGGTAYRDLKKSIRALSNKSAWVNF